MAAVSPCWACGRIFMFDPERVPSISICRGCNRPPDVHDDDCSRTYEILKQPLCRDCMGKVNEQRALINQPPVRILPGAYVE